MAVGFDEGVVIIKLGRDKLTFRMDSSGKVIYTRNQNVFSGTLQTIINPTEDDPTTTTFADGTRLSLSTKAIGSTEIFASSLVHSPNRFVTVVGDGKYFTYTALAWIKSFGNGNSFAWAPDSNTYAVLESKVRLKVLKIFKEQPGVGMKGAGSWSIEGLQGGTLSSPFQPNIWLSHSRNTSSTSPLNWPIHFQHGTNKTYIL